LGVVCGDVSSVGVRPFYPLHLIVFWSISLRELGRLYVTLR